jgi:ADP-heptose:LPS heptosyltransferase/tetratricopeptide (TPR) repeat protein
MGNLCMKSLAKPLGRIAQWQSRLGVVQQADAAQRRGDWAKAARLYEMEIAQSPLRADLLIQLGHCNKERGEYRLAYDSYMRAINIRPVDDDAYLHLGHLLKVSGNVFCASRCYLSAAQLGNRDARIEYDNVNTISTPSNFSLRKKVPVEVSSAGEHPDDDRRLNITLGALEMCEVDPSVVGRLREAARLLFVAGFAAAAKGIFEMSFIRDGFGPIGRRNSVEIALHTRLWGGGGPFLLGSHNDPAYRNPFPAIRRAAIGWLTDEFGEAGGGRSAQFLGNGSHPPDSWREQVSPELRGSFGVDTLAAHATASLQQAAAIRELVSRLYEGLATACADDDWARLRAVMQDLKVSVFDAAPLISFDTDDRRNSIEIHATRVLFNNLYDFVCDNFPLIVGPLASPRVLASISRLECPLFACYLSRASTLYGSPNELIDDIVYEIARVTNKPDDHVRQRALEQVIALIGCRLESGALINLFTVVFESNLPTATAALLHVLMSKHPNNLELMVRVSQTLKHAGYSEIAREILRKSSSRDSVVAGSVEFGVLVEQAILEKICGNFREAVQILSKCLTADQRNQFVRNEILMLLPEIDDIEEVLEYINKDPELRELAQGRRLYRLHLDGWAFHGTQVSGDQDSDVDNLLLELTSAVIKAPGTAYQGERREGVDIVQLGWERRGSQWGDLPVLRGIEAIRVRVISLVPLIAMRVRFDGRTVCLEQVQARMSQTEQKNEYMFNAWFDASALRPGLHELQLYFEEYSGGYRVREELVFVDRLLVRNERTRNSASVVALDDSTSGLPLDERVNSLPSVIYSTRRLFFETPIRRVLVVRADQLGDFVVSIPAIKRLRDLFPEAQFFGLVNPSAMEIARTMEFFEGLFEIKMSYEPMEGRRYLSPQDQIELRRRLGEHSFDLAIDLSTGSDTRPVLRLSGAPVMVGFKPHEFPWLSFGIDAVTHDGVNGRERVPHGTLIMMLVDALGTMLRPQYTVHPARHPNRQLLERFGIGEGEPYLLLHSGSRLLMKRWPLSHYRELARLAIAATNLKVVMLVDDPSQLPEIEGPGLPPDRFCAAAGILPFAELDALVSHCAAMVGNDSGPKHLAASRGAKVVSVHMGQVNWQEWGQEGDGLIVTRHVPCYGCGIVEAHECGKNLACLVHIRPDEVFAAVQQVLTFETEPSAAALGQPAVAPAD